MAGQVQMPWAILVCRYSDDTNDPNLTKISDLAAQWTAQLGSAFVAGNLNSSWNTDNRTIIELYEWFFTITGILTFNSVRYWGRNVARKYLYRRLQGLRNPAATNNSRGRCPSRQSRRCRISKQHICIGQKGSEKSVQR